MGIALVTVTTAFVVRTLIVFGILALCAWLIDQYAIPPEAGRARKAYRAVVAVLLVLWILTTFGII